MTRNKVIDLKDKRPAERNVTFNYCVSFLTALKFVAGHSLSNVTNTNFVIACVQATYNLAEKLGIIVKGKVNEQMLANFQKIKMYNIADRTKSHTQLDITFKSPSIDLDYDPAGKTGTTLKLPHETVEKLNVLAEIWGHRNRSVIIANAAVIYSMLIYEHYVKGLTPFFDPADDIETNIIWRAQQ